MKKIVIGSRESVLAVTQSRMLMDWLSAAHPEIQTELLTMKTTGDKILDRTLDQVGGKGLFVKELELALRDGRADLTVHSLKDVPMETAEDLPLLCFSRREDPRDALVLPQGAEELAPGAVIGSSSARRAIQLKKLFPHNEIKPVRGNLQTRLRKLDSGEFGALVLAAAGLKRLGLEERISRYFTVEEMIPAAGQGILAVQGRAGEDWAFLKGFSDPEATAAALCERAFVRALDGGCSSPVCAHAVPEGDTLRLTGLYYHEPTERTFVETLEGPASEPEALGTVLAYRLMAEAGVGPEPGKVWLVGAGPGDVGLMTLKGRDVLAGAEVVVYDALVGDGVLGLIPDTARRIFAGKRSGTHYLRQEETNRVLLYEALKGKKVVRLKGGDPFVFGRGGEELELLTAYGIPYEVVPGVTSAFAVPAYNGIPVTHRDYCSSVHIITGHRRADRSYDIDFDALRRTGGTLVFLMGIAALPEICAGLLAAGMDPATPAAVLERGTTAKQHRILADLGTLLEVCARTVVQTPAIIVVGKVCRLAEEFAWAEKRPLAGIRVLLTRPKELSSGMAALLRERGCEVLENPAIETIPIRSFDLDGAYAALEDGGYDWVVFTSPSGVRIFFRGLLEKQDIRSLAGVKIAAIGQGTKKALGEYGLRPDFLPTVYDGETLGKELAARCGAGTRILIPRAAIGNPELPAALTEAGCQVTDLATYDTVYPEPGAVDLLSELAAGDIDFAVFTSASTVKGFAQSCPDADFTRVRAVCIGKQTAAAASALGMPVWVAEKATLEALADTLEAAAAELKRERER